MMGVTVQFIQTTQVTRIDGVKGKILIKCLAFNEVNQSNAIEIDNNRYGDHKRERFDGYNRGAPHGYHNRDRDHRDRDRDRDRDRRGVDKRR